MVASKHHECLFLAKPWFRILGSAVGVRYLFLSSFEYASFVEKYCVDVGGTGANLLAVVAVLRRDDFQVYEAVVYCKGALHKKFFFEPC